MYGGSTTIPYHSSTWYGSGTIPQSVSRNVSYVDNVRLQKMLTVKSCSKGYHIKLTYHTIPYGGILPHHNPTCTMTENTESTTARSEKEKMLRGELYQAFAPELVEERQKGPTPLTKNADKSSYMNCWGDEMRG